MTVTPVEVEAQKIEGVPGLDPIHVFWMDVGPGQGYCTIICYGAAWTVYFGGMGTHTIREFIADVGTDYLVPKFGITPHLKATKRDHAYLSRIIEAVKASLKVPPYTCPAETHLCQPAVDRKQPNIPTASAEQARQ